MVNGAKIAMELLDGTTTAKGADSVVDLSLTLTQC